MNKPARFALLGALLAATLSAAPASPPDAASAAADPAADPLLDSMQGELQRASARLSKADPPAYFLSYSAYQGEVATIAASNGSLLSTVQGRYRRAGVVVRVGSPELDNTHGENRRSAIVQGSLPLEDDRDALARSLWWLTNRGYRSSAPAFLKVKTDAAVRSEEEDKSPDFSAEPPQVRVDARMPSTGLDMSEWQARLRRVSALFLKSPLVLDSEVVLQVQNSGFRFTSTEGSRLAEPSHLVRMVIEAMTRADDGMELIRVETYQAPQAADLPSEAALSAAVAKISADLEALRSAPVADPVTVPALLSGRAAAVFFHEVVGHRLEGHRQRDDEEGQTFTKKVGQQVMPAFLSIVDDPTVSSMAGEKLSGGYAFDDEGRPAERVELVQDGVLRNFLMSRKPIKGFSRSNGHGRAEPGLMPTGRQGNLIVTSTNTVKESELHQRLLDEVKKQGKPYGLYFEDVQGGFTLTQRGLPQAFQVLPVIVWRVYADGRPDELVRGVDIVGTPLSALNRILVTGDTMHVFNGICGAESGNVPVSAVAPAMLFSEIEVQKRQHSRERPPLLPPPGFDAPRGAPPAVPAKPVEKSTGTTR
jgi:predicted Zn-dependent protease